MASKKKEEFPAFTNAQGIAIVNEHDLYEDYLDSQITPTDLFYLEDLELARQLVEMGFSSLELEGAFDEALPAILSNFLLHLSMLHWHDIWNVLRRYRSNAEIMSREEFAGFKKVAEAARHAAMAKLPKELYSAGKDVSAYPFLLALQEREKPVREGKFLASHINTTDGNLHPRLFEKWPRGIYRQANSTSHPYQGNWLPDRIVSGYIDYAERIRTTDLEPVFLLKRRFLPTQYDLSYFNWHSNISTTIQTSNWQVIANDETGMYLKNKIDRKVMSMDPTLSSPGDNSTRTVIESNEYEQMIIFDHITRRKL